MVSSILKAQLESKDLKTMIQSAMKEVLQGSLDKLSHITEVNESRIHELDCQLD